MYSLRSMSRAGTAPSSTSKRPKEIQKDEEEEDDSKVVKTIIRKKRVSDPPPVKREKPEDRHTSGQIKETGLPYWEPLNWREQFENIKIMRSSRDAPVDDVGAASLPESKLPHVKRFEVLVSLMLSSQTKDGVTAKAMSNLQEYGLTIEGLIDIKQDKLEQLIFPVGFYRRKAQYLKTTAQILKEKHNGDIPDSLEGLMALPGVGPKMAHLCMDIAWGNVTGIGVDTHVHRIANRLKWVKKPTKTPEGTRKGLEEWLPQSEWSSANLLLVGFGQQICLPLRPKCSECLNKFICPSSLSKK